VSNREVAERIARLYDRRALQGYARWKLRLDRAYGAALQHLRGRNRPLIDLGCGIGLLPLYLREHGVTAPVIGIDFDERKVDAARRAARSYRDVEFIVADAGAPLPEGYDVVLLDLLHYFDRESRQQILKNARDAAGRGGLVLIRQAVHDTSWRARLTAFVDRAARVVRWMRAKRLDLPTREEITGAFDGFEIEVTPLWGSTPYNTYLFVFRART